ncbi:MAG: ATP-binding protein [Candidatus Babeliales bacterium]|nr:ATP-binding protein [Candidatus Babeliales bacterium]
MNRYLKLSLLALCGFAGIEASQSVTSSKSASAQPHEPSAEHLAMDGTSLYPKPNHRRSTSADGKRNIQQGHSSASNRRTGIYNGPFPASRPTTTYTAPLQGASSSSSSSSSQPAPVQQAPRVHDNPLQDASSSSSSSSSYYAPVGISSHTYNNPLGDDYAPSMDTVEVDPELAAEAIKRAPKEVDIFIKDMIRKKDSLDKLKLSKKTLVFVGPSGTGKTCLAKSIATQCGMDYEAFPASTLSNEFGHSGSSNLKRIFRKAVDANKPYVIIIDELQGLLESHSKSGAIIDTDAKALESLWADIDNHANKKIIFIIIFNNVEVFPSQMKTRFGRRIVTIPLPNKTAREQVIAFDIKKQGLEEDSIIFDSSVLDGIQKLVKSSEGLSRRELSEVIEGAIDKAKARNYDNPHVVLDDCLEAIADAYKVEEKIAGEEAAARKRRMNRTRMILNSFKAAGVLVSTTVGVLGIYQYFNPSKIPMPGWGVWIKGHAGSIATTVISAAVSGATAAFVSAKCTAAAAAAATAAAATTTAAAATATPAATAATVATASWCCVQ